MKKDSISILNKYKDHSLVFTLDATKIITNSFLIRHSQLIINQSNKSPLYYKSSERRTFTSDTFM